MTGPSPTRTFRRRWRRARAWQIGISVPFFGTPHQVTHPGGETTRQQGDETRTAHAAVSIVLLHYLLTADGTGLADQWVTFRELPGGLFYAQAFADHAEGVIAAKFGADVAGFRAAAATLGGLPLDLADAAYRFQALPRVPMAVLLWAGDDELPGQARHPVRRQCGTLSTDRGPIGARRLAGAPTDALTSSGCPQER